MAAPRASIDPQLRAQLGRAEPKQRVEAVVAIRTGPQAGGPAAPAEVERAVTELLRRVADETGNQDYEFNVFGYLDSFAIAAEPRFLIRLLEQPEVTSATANR